MKKDRMMDRADLERWIRAELNKAERADDEWYDLRAMLEKGWELRIRNKKDGPTEVKFVSLKARKKKGK
ncbi:MAG TPA: hypothetical protein VMS75_01795 [Terriglobales bacterium]|nr:hypothetical protein [Terriglobales bacterium]